MLRVMFCGEDDDCVTVEMPEGTETDDDAVVARARALLFQTATFDLAVNDYDARSNGNFDEVTVTASHSGSEGIYIFEYRDGEGVRQIPPSTMPSYTAAREEAIRSAIDLLMDLEPGTDDLAGWLVRVRNDQGELLFTIDVQDAEAARQSGL